MRTTTHHIIKYAALNAAATVLYIWGVVSLTTYLSHVIPSEPDAVLAQIFMLLLFIISATATGFFVLGRSVLLYLNGKKRESILLFFATLGALILFAAAFLLTLYVRG